MKKTTSGFTIVELLIVIVVIAILAAITIVAYNGIQQRARASSASSALSQASKKLALYQVDNGAYPLNGNLSAAGVTDSGDVTYQYKTTSSGYCITATNGNVSYKITETGAPSSGGCAGHGQGGVAAVTNLATNPSFETNSTTHLGARGVITLDNTKAFSGSNSLKYVADGTTGGSYLNSTITTDNISNQTLSATIQAQRSTVAANAQLRMYFRDISGTYLAPTGGINGTSVALNTGSWVQATVNGTAPVGTTSIVIYSLLTPGGFVSGSTFWFDGFMLNLGDPVNYADGNSPNWEWNGTANNSTSTGPPL